MNKFRRVFSMMMVLCLLLVLVPVSAAAEERASGTCGKNVTWSLDTDGILTISGEGPIYSYVYQQREVNTPWKSYRDFITGLTVTEGVTGIGEYAFYDCTNLTTVNLASSVTTISAYAFFKCSGLESVELPEGLTSIGSYAFRDCTGLKSVKLPESVTSIGTGAFYNCTSLQSLDLPKDLTVVNPHLFEYCSSLSSVSIPEGVTKICDYAFGYCDALKTIVLPESLVTLEDSAFALSNFVELTIPAAVTNLRRGMFESNFSLKHIWVDEDNPDYSSDACGVLFNKDKTTLIFCPQGYEGTYTIPNGVTEISRAAFSYCDKLTGVTIPGTVENMGLQTFMGCFAMQDIVLEEGITVITKEAFSCCERVESITIPASVTAIESSAFSGCIGLLEIYFEGDAPAIDDYTFSVVKATAYYPVNNDTWTEEVMQNYGGTLVWKPNCPGHVYADEKDTQCDICGAERELDVPTTPMYRLYNPNSGEHFYTGSVDEREVLVSVGWIYEGVAWNAPTDTGSPVYRLFNPNNGDHHYTMSATERDWLASVGWQYEGVCWNSASPDNLPQYRLYNPNADSGSHHYTGSVEERDYLVSIGWNFEGIGWFGMQK